MWGRQICAPSSSPVPRATTSSTTTGAVLAPGNSIEGLRIRFVDSTPAKLEGASPLPGVVNYFHGSTPARGNIPTYERVTQHGVYPAIDVVFHSEEDQLEYDFVSRARRRSYPHCSGF